MIAEDGGGQVRMRLEPPELGRLDMDVRVRNSSVSIVLVAEDRNVQQLLQSQREVLERAMSESGFRVESFDVFLSSSSDAEGGSFDRWQTRREFPGDGPRGFEDGETEAEAIPASDGATENGISIFV